jgi:BirA family biotin operon repressor/biotin-[acetyl-CoA-carboxylase] ligase
VIIRPSTASSRALEAETSELSEHTVAEAAEAAGIPRLVRFVEATGSTNDDVVRLAHEGAPEWTVLVAAGQHAGRGRLGRTWVSTPGASLAVSVLLRPAVEPAKAPIFSLAAATAMAEACEEACGVRAACKWPNDLVAGGRKLGGVLPESRLDGERVAFIVIGVGVNVSQRPSDFPPELRGTATSIEALGGRADAPMLLASYLRRLRDSCAAATPEALAAELGAALERYRALCETLGRTVRATTTDGRRVEGEAVSLGPEGELLVRATGAGKAVAVRFGEVEHLR